MEYDNRENNPKRREAEEEEMEFVVCGFVIPSLLLPRVRPPAAWHHQPCEQGESPNFQIFLNNFFPMPPKQKEAYKLKLPAVLAAELGHSGGKSC